MSLGLLRRSLAHLEFLSKSTFGNSLLKVVVEVSEVNCGRMVLVFSYRFGGIGERRRRTLTKDG